MFCFCFATIECVTDFMIIDIYFSVVATGYIYRYILLLEVGHIHCNRKFK